ncbi:hypothetical protein IIA15_07800 [candidate division TA06 bacterium]|nr:hypothetical protein [candidate division TA06 bacterium]
MSWTLQGERDLIYLNLFGTQGGAQLQPLRIQKELHGHLVNVPPKVIPPLSGTGRNPYKASHELQADHFIRSIRKEKPSLFSSGEEGVKIARIIDAAYLSVKNGGEVKISKK